MAGIDFVGVHKEYEVEEKRLRVLDGIDLHVPDHRITVIVGRSGCGKTTLLRLAGGLEGCTSGEIRRRQGEKAVFVFQEPRLMPWLDVRENILFGLKGKGEQKEIDGLIEIVGLTGFEKAYPNQLSGGMQQRTAIARALACKPDFIMMDEPFAALDHFTREQMQQELLRVRKKSGCGILFVTHSIDEALLLGHKIVLLESGNIQTSYDIPRENEERDLLDKEFIDIKKDIIGHLRKTS